MKTQKAKEGFLESGQIASRDLANTTVLALSKTV
jgi:hypothetical protein